jgi:hypothetical protein
MAGIGTKQQIYIGFSFVAVVETATKQRFLVEKGAGTHRLTTGKAEVLKIIFLKCVTVRSAGTPYRFVPE